MQALEGEAAEREGGSSRVGAAYVAGEDNEAPALRSLVGTTVHDREHSTELGVESAHGGKVACQSERRGRGQHEQKFEG